MRALALGPRAWPYYTVPCGVTRTAAVALTVVNDPRYFAFLKLEL